MPGRTFIVPPIVIDFPPPPPSNTGGSDDVIVFDAVRPDPRRGWYGHCYGLRGFAWSTHGSFERIYYFSPDYVDGNLREHLEHTIVSLWAVVRSELEAAIKAPANPEYHPSVQEALTRWAETRKETAQGETDE